MIFDALGNRMKGYEQASRCVLPLRMPVVIRVDGKCFHSYTRGLARPFDKNLVRVMNSAALELCLELQGARLAYVQSDEISVLLHNYSRLETSAWFDNQIQKMVSVAASVAAARVTVDSFALFDGDYKMAHFDARAFVLPEAEVTNYFLWRQNDASRNSIQMLAQSLYSHRELHGKSQADLHEMCFRKGRNWNDLPTSLRRGRCAVRVERDGRSWWEIDNEIPIWKADGRDYIGRLLATQPEAEAAE